MKEMLFKFIWFRANKRILTNSYWKLYKILTWSSAYYDVSGQRHRITFGWRNL